MNESFIVKFRMILNSIPPFKINIEYYNIIVTGTKNIVNDFLKKFDNFFS